MLLTDLQHDGFVHTGRVPLRSGVRVHSGYCCVPLDLFVVVVTTPWQGGSSQLLCFDFDLHPVPLCDIELYHVSAFQTFDFTLDVSSERGHRDGISPWPQ